MGLRFNFENVEFEVTARSSSSRHIQGYGARRGLQEVCSVFILDLRVLRVYDLVMGQI